MDVVSLQVLQRPDVEPAVDGVQRHGGGRSFHRAGAIGYTLSKRDRFVAGTAWSDSVIWWQIGVGLALLPLAVYLSRKGARSLTPNPRAELRH
jgi:hypothetical protein